MINCNGDNCNRFYINDRLIKHKSFVDYFNNNVENFEIEGFTGSTEFLNSVGSKKILFYLKKIDISEFINHFGYLESNNVNELEIIENNKKENDVNTLSYILIIDKSLETFKEILVNKMKLVIELFDIYLLSKSSENLNSSTDLVFRKIFGDNIIENDLNKVKKDLNDKTYNEGGSSKKYDTDTIIYLLIEYTEFSEIKINLIKKIEDKLKEIEDNKKSDEIYKKCESYQNFEFIKQDPTEKLEEITEKIKNFDSDCNNKEPFLNTTTMDLINSTRKQLDLKKDFVLGEIKQIEQIEKDKREKERLQAIIEEGKKYDCKTSATLGEWNKKNCDGFIENGFIQTGGADTSNTPITPITNYELIATKERLTKEDQLIMDKIKECYTKETLDEWDAAECDNVFKKEYILKIQNLSPSEIETISNSDKIDFSEKKETLLQKIRAKEEQDRKEAERILAEKEANLAAAEAEMT